MNGKSRSPEQAAFRLAVFLIIAVIVAVSSAAIASTYSDMLGYAVLGLFALIVAISVFRSRPPKRETQSASTMATDHSLRSVDNAAADHAEPQDGVSVLLPKRTSLKFRAGLQDVVLTIDSGKLRIEEGISDRVTTRLFDLWSLSRNLGTTSRVSEEGLSRVRIGLVTSLAAGALYFSAYQPDIPFLSPLVLLVGVFYLWTGLQLAGAGPRTVIYDLQLNSVTTIPHIGVNKEERLAFEQTLCASVDASQEAYSSGSSG